MCVGYNGIIPNFEKYIYVNIFIMKWAQLQGSIKLNSY